MVDCRQWRRGEREISLPSRGWSTFFLAVAIPRLGAWATAGAKDRERDVARRISMCFRGWAICEANRFHISAIGFEEMGMRRE